MSAKQVTGRALQWRKYWSDAPDLMISLSIAVGACAFWPVAWWSVNRDPYRLHQHRIDYTVIRPEDVDPKKPADIYN